MMEKARRSNLGHRPRTLSRKGQEQLWRLRWTSSRKPASSLAIKIPLAPRKNWRTPRRVRNASTNQWRDNQKRKSSSRPHMKSMIAALSKDSETLTISLPSLAVFVAPRRVFSSSTKTIEIILAGGSSSTTVVSQNTCDQPSGPSSTAQRRSLPSLWTKNSPMPTSMRCFSGLATTVPAMPGR